MKWRDRCTDWLETHWVNPAYSGWLIGGLALFFFAAATNTLAGWLYVISGFMVAILSLAVLLALQTLKGLQVQRNPIAPVSVGEFLTLELLIHNSRHRPKTLIQVLDQLPPPWLPMQTAIEQIPAQAAYRWTATVTASQRGIYHWHTVQLRTASPLGLFWCRQNQTAKAKAVVYPTVLPLGQCPIIDQIGQQQRQISSYPQAQLATEGITRTLRPYRWGDSTRLIHWRSSARYGELRVRELETHRGGQDLIIALDQTADWISDWFEQAIVAAVSLYFYALQRQISVRLWTAETGLISGNQLVLETLAAIQPEAVASVPLQLPSLWLTQTPESLTTLPAGSRYLCWQSSEIRVDRLSLVPTDWVGLTIQPEALLAPQLQNIPNSNGLQFSA